VSDPSVDGKILLRWNFRKWDVGVWIRSSWLRIRRIALLDENLLASQETLCSMEMSRLGVNDEVHVAVSTVV
jgi:hypothetical protein